MSDQPFETWHQTASAASDKKCRNLKLFLLIFCPNFDKFFWGYMTQHMLSNSLLHKFKNIFGFCSLFISFCYTFEKNLWKRQKFTFHSQHILSHIASESKEKISKFGLNWTKTHLSFDTFYQGCWGCLRSKMFQIVNQA